MTTYTYSDAYISPQVTLDRENRAMVDVAQLGTFPDTWAQRLTVLRAYITTCIECAKSPDDMWTTKLSAYRKEFDSALPQARAAQAAIDAQSNTLKGGSSVFTCDLQRG